MRYKWLAIALAGVIVAGLAGMVFMLQNSGEDDGETAAVHATVYEENADVQVQTPVQPDETPGTDNAQAENPVKKLKIVAVGDIMLGRGVGMRLDNQNKDYKYPFGEVKEILEQGHIIFGNLEGPITDREHSLDPKWKYVLRNKNKACSTIEYAGFNMLSLANNHIMDYYEEGLYDTLNILDDKGIAHSGAGRNLSEARKPAIIEREGFKVGMLSYTDMANIVYKGQPSISFVAGENKAGVAPTDYGYIKEDVEKLRKDVDILILSLHWGVEESFRILPEQTQMAHELLDSGVDIILGHHPHQFQGIEVYKGKPIVYSMGNFIFDQNDRENQEGFILTMEYTDRELIQFEAIPIRTVGKTRVVSPSGDEAEELLKREAELSQKLNTKCSIENDKIIFDIKSEVISQ